MWTEVPSSLAIPDGNSVKELLFAIGSQHYSYNGSAWVLFNATADLFDFKGANVGYHYFLEKVDALGGRPTWETFHPASRVTGIAINSVPQVGTIAWVLLQATTTNGSSEYLGSTTYIQRLYTQHGLPPAEKSHAKEGEVFESAYTALYTFASKD